MSIKLKCRICEDIIEGNRNEIVSCKCGSVSINESMNNKIIGDYNNILIMKDEKFVPLISYKRISKDNYYLNIAEEVANRSTCLKRHYGAIIVKNDEIISTRF